MSDSNARQKLPIILLISLKKEPWLDDMYQKQFSKLRERGRVYEVTQEKDISHYLDSGSERATAVIVTDAALINAKPTTLGTKLLVEYARGGGTVIFGGVTASFSRPKNFEKCFADAWGLPWEMGSYRGDRFTINPSATAVKDGGPLSSLPHSFTMKALSVKGVDKKDCIYFGDQMTTITESPVVYAAYGTGHVGWIGDVNAEEEIAQAVIAMCGFGRY